MINKANAPQKASEEAKEKIAQHLLISRIPQQKASEDVVETCGGQNDFDKTIKNAVIVSIIVGIAVAAYLFWTTTIGDNYTVIYIQPDSYSNYLDGNSIKFAYGIQQYGKSSNSYLMDIFIGNTLVATRDLKKRTGLNEIVLQVPENIQLPTKVSLNLKTDYGENEVHFWIKGKLNETEGNQ